MIAKLPAHRVMNMAQTAVATIDAYREESPHNRTSRVAQYVKAHNILQFISELDGDTEVQISMDDYIALKQLPKLTDTSTD